VKKSNIVQLPQPKIVKREIKFTQASIKSFKSDKKGIVWSSNHKYLGIRVQQGNSYTFITKKKNTKISLSPITVTIGDITGITLSKAVELHQQNLALISSGVNPNKIINGVVEESEPTVLYYVEQRLKRIEKQQTTMGSGSLTLNKGLLNNHLIDLGARATFSSLTEKKLQDFYLSKTPSVARQCMSLLSSTFNKLSAKQRKDTENPRDVIKRLELPKDPRTKKNVYLKFGLQGQGNIGRFFEALTLAEHGYIPDTLPDGTDLVIIPPITSSRTTVDILLMYLLTSVRKENIQSLKWTEVNFEDELITFLEPKGQKGKEEPIPQELSMDSYLRALLSFRFKNRTSDYVFPMITDPTKPYDLKTIDSSAQRVALIMCLYGDWNEKEVNPVLPIAKKFKHDSLRNYQLWKLCSDLVRKGNTDIGLKLREDLNNLGTKPHGLRRTLSNVAEITQVGSRTIESILARNPSDTSGKHYIEVQRDAVKNALETCHRFIDNRIAEYLGDYKVEKEGRTFFKSPILAFYGIEALIERDKAYDENAFGFTDGRKKVYKYGDIEL
jgi:integrase|tara:strand:+ start:4469 stop:6133 length:1665 start_codon:yes stop_codon:yes gene_type:complete